MNPTNSDSQQDCRIPGRESVGTSTDDLVSHYTATPLAALPRLSDSGSVSASDQMPPPARNQHIPQRNYPASNPCSPRETAVRQGDLCLMRDFRLHIAPGLDPSIYSPRVNHKKEVHGVNLNRDQQDRFQTPYAVFLQHLIEDIVRSGTLPRISDATVWDYKRKLENSACRNWRVWIAKDIWEYYHYIKWVMCPQTATHSEFVEILLDHRDRERGKLKRNSLEPSSGVLVDRVRTSRRSAAKRPRRVRIESDSESEMSETSDSTSEENNETIASSSFSVQKAPAGADPAPCKTAPVHCDSITTLVDQPTGSDTSTGPKQQLGLLQSVLSPYSPAESTAVVEPRRPPKTSNLSSLLN